MGNHHHEDLRYRKYYDRTPHGEIPRDDRLRHAREDGVDPAPEKTEEAGAVGISGLDPNGKQESR